MLPSGEDAVLGIGPGIIGGGLDGWLSLGILLFGILSLGIGVVEGWNGAGIGDPDDPGIDGPGVDGVDPPVA